MKFLKSLLLASLTFSLSSFASDSNMKCLEQVLRTLAMKPISSPSSDSDSEDPYTDEEFSEGEIEEINTRKAKLLYKEKEKYAQERGYDSLAKMQAAERAASTRAIEEESRTRPIYESGYAQIMWAMGTPIHVESHLPVADRDLLQQMQFLRTQEWKIQRDAKRIAKQEQRQRKQERDAELKQISEQAKALHANVAAFKLKYPRIPDSRIQQAISQDPQANS